MEEFPIRKNHLSSVNGPETMFSSKMFQIQKEDATPNREEFGQDWKSENMTSFEALEYSTSSAEDYEKSELEKKDSFKVGHFLNFYFY